VPLHLRKPEGERERYLMSLFKRMLIDLGSPLMGANME